MPRSIPDSKWIVDPEDPRDWWNTRDRRFRSATIGLGAVSGAAFLASGGFLIGSYMTEGAAVKTDAGARATAVIGGLTLAALVGVGTAWAVYRVRGWEAPPVVRDWPPTDPRLDPGWIERDRQLRAATIGVGAFAGIMLLSMPATYGIFAATHEPGQCSEPDSCNAPVSAEMAVLFLLIAEGALLGAGVVALTGVGTAWGAHRKPLRRWKMSLAPGGLEIRF
ncbi:hypothetical protein SAMN02745121_08121 [Nannocystis exedens]|uniref:Uncharacterized protein n=1 Tax=Nannocystis exedens TaxID=54 RepID=A0A1I2HTD7_9BACT|nr:hypothetical protein [Nannocystis exedens]PCC69424.1 hypothetical protein NAEX_02446 [Nannocystis exedens]SFF31996.1 hypothetical protein SAMN02745121_08121 [Nannocystis exedens]